MTTPQLVGVLVVAIVLASVSIQVAWQVRKDCKRSNDIEGWREYDMEDRRDDC